MTGQNVNVSSINADNGMVTIFSVPIDTAPGYRCLREESLIC